MDTTSNTLSRTLHLLAEHPDVQGKLRQELQEAHAAHGLSYEELNKLPLLDCVCRETLRVYVPTIQALSYIYLSQNILTNFDLVILLPLHLGSECASLPMNRSMRLRQLILRHAEPSKTPSFHFPSRSTSQTGRPSRKSRSPQAPISLLASSGATSTKIGGAATRRSGSRSAGCPLLRLLSPTPTSLEYTQTCESSTIICVTCLVSNH